MVYKPELFKKNTEADMPLKDWAQKSQSEHHVPLVIAGHRAYLAQFQRLGKEILPLNVKSVVCIQERKKTSTEIHRHHADFPTILSLLSPTM